jgi:CBS domain-containing protein
MEGIFYRFHLLLNPDSTCEVLMLTAKDIMTRDVLSVSPDTSIEELSSILVKNEISGVPVVDDAGALYGIVTENDLISRNKRLHIPTVVSFLDAAIYLESSKKFEQEVKRLTATRVGDICSRKVVTIAEDTTVTDIATIMSEKKAHLLPVLRGGKVVGIVGKRDMVKAVARQAE